MLRRRTRIRRPQMEVVGFQNVVVFFVVIVSVLIFYIITLGGTLCNVIQSCRETVVIDRAMK